MFKTLLYVCLFSTSLFIAACSNEEEKKTSAVTQQPTKEHFATDQKRAFDQAKGVEKMLQDSADQRAKQIEEQTK